MLNRLHKDAFFIGIALFTMFFGGGNILFPPYIGMLAGEDWFFAFFGYFIIETGLIFLVLAALVKSGHYEHIGSIFTVLGKKVSLVFIFILMLSVTFVVVPRTVVVSHDVLFSKSNSPKGLLLLYSVIYFSLSLFFAFRRSKIVNYISKIFTPILLISLAILVILVIIHPFGTTNSPSKVESSFMLGVEAGYQTMDFLGLPFFCLLVMNVLNDAGYKTRAEKGMIIFRSSFIIIFLMFMAYLGLTYVGATASSSFASGVVHTDFLNSIFSQVFGSKAVVIINVAITVSCLTTAIALTSTMASNISAVFGDRVNYKVALIFISFIFAILSTLGIESIIKYASYIIAVILPSVLVMTVFNFFEDRIKNLNSIRLPIALVSIESIIEQFYKGGVDSMSFISKLPFYDINLAWVFIAMVGFIIGLMIPYKERKNDKSNG